MSHDHRHGGERQLSFRPYGTDEKNAEDEYAPSAFPASSPFNNPS